MSDAVVRYRRPAQVLHWTVAAFVFAMIPAGIIMIQQGIPRPLQNGLFIFHKNFGLVVLLVVLVRLAYRAAYPPPPLPASVTGLQRRAAAVSHAALYVLLVAMPVLGYVRVKAGGFPIESLDALGVPSLVPQSDTLAAIAKTGHFIGGLTLAALIFVHIGAAIYHAVVLRDGVFSRMASSGRAAREAPVAET